MDPTCRGDRLHGLGAAHELTRDVGLLELVHGRLRRGAIAGAEAARVDSAAPAPCERSKARGRDDRGPDAVADPAPALAHPCVAGSCCGVVADVRYEGMGSNTSLPVTMRATPEAPMSRSASNANVTEPPSPRHVQLGGFRSTFSHTMFG